MVPTVPLVPFVGFMPVVSPAAPGWAFISSSPLPIVLPCMGLLCTVPLGLAPDDVPCARTGVTMRAETAHAIAEVFTNFIHFSWIFAMIGSAA